MAQLWASVKTETTRVCISWVMGPIARQKPAVVSTQDVYSLAQPPPLLPLRRLREGNATHCNASKELQNIFMGSCKLSRCLIHGNLQTLNLANTISFQPQ